MVDKRIKMAIIAGAARALAIKAANQRISDEEIIQKVSSESSEIVRKLDTE